MLNLSKQILNPNHKTKWRYDGAGLIILGLEPRIEHYGCLVDILDSVGLLEEAEELNMSIQADEVYMEGIAWCFQDAWEDRYG